MKRVWFPFYAADFWADSKVAQLTDAQFRMLIRVWCRLCMDRSVPAEPSGFAKVMGIRLNVSRWALEWLPNWLSLDPATGNRYVSERMEKEMARYDAIVERNRVNGKKGGRPRNPVANPVANPKITESQSQSQKDSSTVRKRKTKNVPVEEKPERLEDILDWNDMDWREVFMEVYAPFPPEKKKNFFTLAKQFRAAVKDEGATAEQLHLAVSELCKSVSSKQYLPDATKWMSERGWMAYAAR